MELVGTCLLPKKEEKMSDLLYLLPVLPTLAVAMMLFRILLKKHQEAEEKMVAARVASRRAVERSREGR